MTDEKTTEIIPADNRNLAPPLEGNPEVVIEFATKASKALKNIVDTKPKKVIINKEQYLEFEDWQTVARFYGGSVGTDWTKPINKDGKVFGFEARAVVYNHGEIIGSAEASCTREEKNWVSKPEFQLKSMAQTRACAKALRQVYGWVVVLAGYKSTPAEEMDGITNGHEKTFNEEITVVPEPTVTRAKMSDQDCEACGVKLTKRVCDYSVGRYKKALCFDCQKKEG